MEIQKGENGPILKDISLNHSTEYVTDQHCKLESSSRKNSEVDKLGEKPQEMPLQVKSEPSTSFICDSNSHHFKVVVQQLSANSKPKEELPKKTKTGRQVKLEPYFMTYQSEESCAKKSEPNPGSFFEYTRLRTEAKYSSTSNRINLKVFTLGNVLELAVQKQIIPYQVYLNYQYRIHAEPERSFVHFLEKKHLEKFQFNQYTFCPLDHRLLCFYLTKKYPQQFIFPDSVLTTSKQMTNFYSFLYQLTDEEYFQIYDEIRSRFNRHWMPKGTRIKKMGVDEDDGLNQLFYFSKVRKLRKV